MIINSNLTNPMMGLFKTQSPRPQKIQVAYSTHNHNHKKINLPNAYVNHTLGQTLEQRLPRPQHTTFGAPAVARAMPVPRDPLAASPFTNATEGGYPPSPKLAMNKRA